MKAKWVRGHHFAEVAEALNISTDAIMAEMPLKNEVGILFTPDDHPEEVWQAVLRRDEDGILRECRERVEIPGFMENLQRSIERELPE